LSLMQSLVWFCFQKGKDLYVSKFLIYKFFYKLKFLPSLCSTCSIILTFCCECKLKNCGKKWLTLLYKSFPFWKQNQTRDRISGKMVNFII
jgi:hypothetical protein